MQPQHEILGPDSLCKGADENETPPKCINCPNETAYVPIFYDNRNLLTGNLHLVCIRILQITEMGCCGNCHVQFRLLGGRRKRTPRTPSETQMQRGFYCSSRPKRTNLLTVGLFFHSFKNGLAFCHLHFYYVYYQFMQMERKNP